MNKTNHCGKYLRRKVKLKNGNQSYFVARTNCDWKCWCETERLITNWSIILDAFISVTTTTKTTIYHILCQRAMYLYFAILSQHNDNEFLINTSCNLFFCFFVVVALFKFSIRIVHCALVTCFAAHIITLINVFQHNIRNAMVFQNK